MDSINSLGGAVTGIVVVMLLGAVGGWLAGTGMFYANRYKDSRMGSIIIICTIVSLGSYAVIFAPLFQKVGNGNAAVALGFFAMMIVPSALIGAITAWHLKTSRQINREKFRALYKSLGMLKAGNSSQNTTIISKRT